MSLLQDPDYVITHLRAAYLSNYQDGIGQKVIRPTHLYITKNGPNKLNWAATSVLASATPGSPPISTISLAGGRLSSRNRKIWARSNTGNEENASGSRAAVNGSGSIRVLRPRASTLPISSSVGGRKNVSADNGRRSEMGSRVGEGKFTEDTSTASGRRSHEFGTQPLADETGQPDGGDYLKEHTNKGKTNNFFGNTNGNTSNDEDGHTNEQTEADREDSDVSFDFHGGHNIDSQGLLAMHMNKRGMASPLDSHTGLMTADSDNDFDYTSSDMLSDDDNDDEYDMEDDDATSIGVDGLAVAERASNRSLSSASGIGDAIDADNASGIVDDGYDSSTKEASYKENHHHHHHHHLGHHMRMNMSLAEQPGFSEEDDSDMEEDMRFAVEQMKLRAFNEHDTDSLTSSNPSPSARARAQSIGEQRLAATGGVSGIAPSGLGGGALNTTGGASGTGGGGIVTSPLSRRVNRQKSTDALNSIMSGGRPRARRMSVPNNILPHPTTQARRRNTDERLTSYLRSTGGGPETQRAAEAGTIIDEANIEEERSPDERGRATNGMGNPVNDEGAGIFGSGKARLDIVRPTTTTSKLTASMRVKDDNPLDQYAIASGKSERNPLKLKMFMPSCSQPKTPWTVVVRTDVNVASAIGFALYCYMQDKRSPELTLDQCDANRWNLRIVEEDGEPDEDFPALDRTRIISSFSFDEFALVEATDAQAQDNQRITPECTNKKVKAGKGDGTNKNGAAAGPNSSPASADGGALSGPSRLAINAPVITAKPIKIYSYPYDELVSKPIVTMTVDSNTKIGNILSKVCAERAVDQSMFAFKLAGTRVLVLSSTEIGTLAQANLELTPKRVITSSNGYDLSFIVASGANMSSSIGGGAIAGGNMGGAASTGATNGFVGNIGGSLPTANTMGNGVNGVDHLPFGGSGSGSAWARHKQIQKAAELAAAETARTSLVPEALLTGAGYQKYFIWRRQPMSFISRHERILAIDGEYVHIMPSEDRTWFDSPKTSSFHINQIIKCKQSSKVPANFKIVIMKTSGPKRYDLEAVSAAAAQEIVTKLRRLAQKYHEL